MAWMILKDLNDDTKLKVENRSDKQGIMPAPEWIIDGTEELVWCFVEQVQDPVTNAYSPKLTVDPIKKQQILDARFNDELAKEAEKAAKQARKDAIKAIKKVDISTAGDLQNFILDLRDYLAEEGLL